MKAAVESGNTHVKILRETKNMNVIDIKKQTNKQTNEEELNENGD